VPLPVVLRKITTCVRVGNAGPELHWGGGEGWGWWLVMGWMMWCGQSVMMADVRSMWLGVQQHVLL